MKLRMSLEGPHADRELRSLYRWLREQRAELGEAGVSVHALDSFPEEGEMGGAFEVIQFVIGTTTDLATLALAITAWRQAHDSRSQGRLTGEDGQGGQDGQDGRNGQGGERLTPQELAETRAVLRALRQLRDGGEVAQDGADGTGGAGGADGIDGAEGSGR